MMRLIQILLVLMLSSFTASAEKIQGVGIKKLAVNDPVDHRSMDAVLFFPSAEHATGMIIGPYRIDASKDLQIQNATYPLILVSHGNMGNMSPPVPLAATMMSGCWLGLVSLCGNVGIYVFSYCYINFTNLKRPWIACKLAGINDE